MGKIFLVCEPTGMGKTQMVLKKIFCTFKRDSVKRWNRRLRETLVLGPNDEVERTWLRELALLARAKGMTNGSATEDDLRDMSAKRLRSYLAKEVGFVHLRYCKFRSLTTIAQQRGTWLVVDEWHDLPSVVHNACRAYLRDRRMNIPWYLGGGFAQVFLVSATPVNPTLEREDEELGRTFRPALSVEEFKNRCLEALGRSITVLRTAAGSRRELPADVASLFFPAVESLKIDVLRRHGRRPHWKLPEPCRWAAAEGGRELEKRELREMVRYVDGAEDSEGIRGEYAWAVGLIRTKEDKKRHVLNSSQRVRTCFKFPYCTLHSVDSKKPKDALDWLVGEHTRVQRLVGLLRAEGILVGSDSHLRIRRKVLVFCLHRGVAVGLSRTLRRILGVEVSDSHEIPVVASNADPSDLSRAEGLQADTSGLEVLINEFRKQGRSPKILVATDRLSESIDLHEACRCVVHYELPWSPLRLFQRVGRLTRLKSRGGRVRLNRDVRVGHVVIPGSVEEERVNRLVRRIQFMHEQGLWPQGYGDKQLVAGLIGGGPSLHYEWALREP